MPSQAQATKARLIAFLSQHGASSAGSRATHTLLTHPYGRFCIPPGPQLVAFQRLYAQAVMLGFNPGVVEVKAWTRFRLFVDLDLKLPLGTQQLDPADKEAMLKAVQRAAASLFADSSSSGEPPVLEGLVASCRPYVKAGAVKAGFHIVWPQVFVDQEAALAFRAACIRELDAAAFSSKPLCSCAWQDVVDATVYKQGTGLRMMGAAKQDRAATIYMPDCILLLPSTIRAVDPEDVYGILPDWLQRCSLCVPCSSSSSRPAAAAALAQPRAKAKAKGRHMLSSSVPSTCQHALAPSACPELVEAVRQAITHKLAGDFKTAGIRSVRLYSEALALLVTDSKRCLNLRQRNYHSSNHTYLIVQPDRICQRCHSDRTAGVLYAPCAKFNLDISVAPSPFSAHLGTQEEHAGAMARLPALLKQAWHVATASQALEEEQEPGSEANSRDAEQVHHLL